jgi:hypothetical protein
MQPLTLHAILLHHNTAASYNFARVAFTINLAQSSPRPKDFGITDFDEVDLVLRAEGLDELDVFSFSACLDKDAEVGLAFVKGFGAFAETASETVVDEGVFQNLL